MTEVKVINENNHVAFQMTLQDMLDRGFKIAKTHYQVVLRENQGQEWLDEIYVAVMIQETDDDQG